jgi:transposase
MELYGAIDLHSNNSMVVLLDKQDRAVVERRLPNKLPVILDQLEPYKPYIQAIAVESTYNWYWLVDGLMEAGYEVRLVNTVKVAVYEGLKYSDDEHDARHLAHLLRLGILPTGYIYPKEERSMRDLLRKRAHLVRCRTSQILSIQNLITRNTGQGISQENLRRLDDQALEQLCGGDPARVLAIQSSRAVLRCLDEQVNHLEKTLLAQAKLKPGFEKLLTVDGIGPVLGMTIMYEIGSIERFKEAGHFASYARCVGSRRLSNGKKKGEGNTKNGNKYLAWAFIEAAAFSIRYNERIRRFFQRKKAKRTTALAMKAVAHKLARACYHVLKDQTTFDVDRAFA